MATKRKTSTPDATRITSIRLAESQYEALRVLAFQERRSVSAQLRFIVDEALAQKTGEKAAA